MELNVTDPATLHLIGIDAESQKDEEGSFP